ncbi:carbohydrate ABC transporter permease [Streptomyces sp. NPDC006265]|uniref:carbohydrate ABC transporter permease n=1 Tax=Streptomyces sp. NPDC006265 TaxID=3156740 RepID=UPI0033BD462E
MATLATPVRKRGHEDPPAQGQAPAVRAFRATPFTYGTLLIVAAILTTPLVFVGSIALAGDATVNNGGFTIIPREFNWDNFSRVFTTELPVGTFLLNSVLISLFSVAGQVLSSGLVGYAFARLRAPGKNTMFLVVIATMMIPTQITMIPQFILFRDLGWVNTFLPLIVPNFFSNAFNVFLVRQFVSRLPSELDEAEKKTPSETPSDDDTGEPTDTSTDDGTGTGNGNGNWTPSYSPSYRPSQSAPESPTGQPSDQPTTAEPTGH